MKAGKCPNCGANISVDETKDAGICEYCNTAFVTEKATNQVNNTTNNAQTIINNYYTSEKSSKNVKKVEDDDEDEDKRPELSIVIAVLLCWLYLVPGIIYIILTKQKQKEWDKAHGVNK